MLLAWCHLLLNQAVPAIDQLSRSIAGRPRYWVNHIALAAALGLTGDLEGAKAALAESADHEAGGQLAGAIPHLPPLG